MKAFYNRLKQEINKLKSEAGALVIAYRDKRTPILAKLVILITIGYLLSPVDLIPDFIPVLGLIDDLVIVPLLILLALKLIPTAVLADARELQKKGKGLSKKSNWFFGIIFILVWIYILYIILKLIINKGWDLG